MLLLIRKPATPEQIAEMAKDYDGYIKVVIDIERGITTGGGRMHVDGEQALLAEGSKQKHLWGGGIDWETKEVDYNSMINLRPRDGNPSRDILSLEIRQQFDTIVQRSLLRAVQLLETGDADIAIGFGDAFVRSGCSPHYAGSVRMKGGRPRFQFWVLGLFHLSFTGPEGEQKALALEEFLYLARLQRGSVVDGGPGEGARHQSAMGNRGEARTSSNPPRGGGEKTARHERRLDERGTSLQCENHLWFTKEEAMLLVADAVKKHVVNRSHHRPEPSRFRTHRPAPVSRKQGLGFSFSFPHHHPCDRPPSSRQNAAFSHRRNREVRPFQNHHRDESRMCVMRGLCRYSAK